MIRIKKRKYLHTSFTWIFSDKPAIYDLYQFNDINLDHDDKWIKTISK